ncbi:MAG: SDR family NAD(P)-dependent oxidoreductase [Nannocystaceae bacterium]|nr:SDR family NAD(P)-dependent oxidoreductase [Nannocystaceae bacterium]
MKTVADRVALVTGASRGIGPFIAKTLAAQGCTVVGVARNREGLDETVGEITQAGGKAFAVQGDLADLANLPAVLEAVESAAGSPIDFLINNAGVEFYRRYTDYTAQELASVLTLNLHVPLELTRLLLPKLLARGRGHIVSVASLAGKKGVLYNGPYSASKAGVLLWTDALRQEVAGTGVGVSVVVPGYIRDAGMFHGDDVSPPKFLGTSSPQDVADAVVQAIKHDRQEIIVNPGPMRPMLALGQLSPALANRLVDWMGVNRTNAARRRDPK